MLVVELSEPRALAELKKPDRTGLKRIVRFLEERLAGKTKPRHFGKPLTSDKVGLCRYRVGHDRVVCQIDSERPLFWSCALVTARTLTAERFNPEKL